MNLHTPEKHLAFILLISAILTSCAGVKNTRLKKQLAESNCNQQNVYSYTRNDLPQPIYKIEPDTALSARFSFKSLNIANAIGILDLLEEYVNIRKDFNENPSPEKRLDLIEYAQKINQRINISSLEISAVASEMDCEEERADQIATYLKGKEDDAETKFTVGAIVVGAAGAITAGVLFANGDDSNVPELIGIGTGLTEGTLGMMILLNKRKAEFYHPRNALREIWEAHDTSTIFPVPVWYYLNYFNPNRPDQPSLRYQIIERWMNFGQISAAKSKRKRNLIDVYFGEGGKYTAEQLHARANMLDQLEAHINLMKQDLKGLALELENLK